MPKCAPNWLNAAPRKGKMNKTGQAVEPALPMQTWTVVADGMHNAFTDLLYWQNAFWMVFVASPSHFASPKSRLVLLRSADAIQWQEVTRLSGDGQDIRDPKLAVIHDHLLVYALLNRAFDPQPYQTICAQSRDGETWSRFTDAAPAGWLLGKPQTPDGATWYAPAHHLKQGAACVLQSKDGLRWETRAFIYEKIGSDETALVFDAQASLTAVTRLESGPGMFGSPGCGTIISIARPPYEKWDFQGTSTVTRLDGPALFSCGQTYAVGRFQPQIGGRLHGQGSILSRKRTSIFSVSQHGLTHLADLPSSGDTAYAGVVLTDKEVFISYYTNDPARDMSWIQGMLRPTQIRLARMPMSAFLGNKG